MIFASVVPPRGQHVQAVQNYLASVNTQDDCQALPTNVPEPLRISSMTSSPSLIPELLSSYLYYRLISVTDSSTRPCLTINSTLSLLLSRFHYQLNFTIDSTLLSTRPYLCSEPMDFIYYSIRRRDRTHGGERVELMIDG